MRNTTIENKYFLGLYTHQNKLKVGDVQKMTFTHIDEGPFYLNKQQQWHQRYVTIKDNKTEHYPKPKLIRILKDKAASGVKVQIAVAPPSGHKILPPSFCLSHELLQYHYTYTYHKS